MTTAAQYEPHPVFKDATEREALAVFGEHFRSRVPGYIDELRKPGWRAHADPLTESGIFSRVVLPDKEARREIGPEFPSQQGVGVMAYPHRSGPEDIHIGLRAQAFANLCDIPVICFPGDTPWSKSEYLSTRAQTLGVEIGARAIALARLGTIADKVEEFETDIIHPFGWSEGGAFAGIQAATIAKLGELVNEHQLEGSPFRRPVRIGSVGAFDAPNVEYRDRFSLICALVVQGGNETSTAASRSLGSRELERVMNLHKPLKRGADNMLYVLGTLVAAGISKSSRIRLNDFCSNSLGQYLNDALSAYPDSVVNLAYAEKSNISPAAANKRIYASLPEEARQVGRVLFTPIPKAGHGWGHRVVCGANLARRGVAQHQELAVQATYGTGGQH